MHKSWENTVFRILQDFNNVDEIYYWRTSAGNEVDFVLPYNNPQKAIEVKFDEGGIKRSKYKIFERTFPKIPISFFCQQPFNEDFFLKITTLKE